MMRLTTAHVVGGGGISRQQASIRAIGLGSGADHDAVSAKARSMDDLDRQTGTPQCLHQRLLIAAGRFHHDAADRRSGLKLGKQRGNASGAICVMGAIAPMPGHVKTRTTNVDTDKAVVRCLRGCHDSPAFHEAGPAPGSSNVRPALTTVRVSGPSDQTRRGTRFRRSSKTFHRSRNARLEDLLTEASKTYDPYTQSLQNARGAIQLPGSWLWIPGSPPTK